MKSDRYVLVVPFYSPDDAKMYKMYDEASFFSHFETFEDWYDSDDYLSWVEVVEAPKDMVSETSAYHFPKESVLDVVIIEA